MIIHPLEVTDNGSCAVASSRIEFAGRQDTLWYSVEKRYAPYVTTEKLDAFVIGLLPLAMKTGEDIIVNGPVSERLHYNLAYHYQYILSLITPSFKRIRIIPGSLHDGKNYTCEGGVVTGFSAGIDSLSTVHDYLLSDAPSRYKITHFIFNNAGSHGEWDIREARIRFNARYDMLKAFAQQLGIDFIKIDSNLSDILMMKFQKTHVTRNISCALILQKLFSKLLYSSATRYEDSFIGETNDQAYSDPASVHLLSTETLECISTGSQYSRIEKTRQAVSIEGAKKWLNVCLFPPDPENPRNCSQCGKCMLTMFTLELLNVLNDYKEVFDLDIWKRQRNLYIITTILGKSDNPLLREVREYVKSIGYSFTPWQRFWGYVFRLLPVRITRLILSNYRRIEWAVIQGLRRNNDVDHLPFPRGGTSSDNSSQSAS